MLTFVFWNLNRRPIYPLVADLAQEQRADVLILAETASGIVDLLRALNVGRATTYGIDPTRAARTTILTAFPTDFLSPVSDPPGLSIRALRTPLGNDVLLVAAHLRSKLYQDSRDQA